MPIYVTLYFLECYICLFTFSRQIPAYKICCNDLKIVIIFAVPKMRVITSKGSGSGAAR